MLHSTLWQHRTRSAAAHVTLAFANKLGLDGFPVDHNACGACDDRGGGACDDRGGGAVDGNNCGADHLLKFDVGAVTYAWSS